MYYSSQRERGFQSPGNRTMVLVLKPLSNSFAWEEERLTCSGIFGKGAVRVWVAPLGRLIFKGCLRLFCGLLAGNPVGGLGWPAISVGLGWACSVLRGGWLSKPHPPKQLWLVTTLTFSSSLTWPHVSHLVLNLECARHGQWKYWLISWILTDAQLISACGMQIRECL